MLVLVAFVGVGLIGQPFDRGVGTPPTPPAASTTESPSPAPPAEVPDFLRHEWARPYAVTPDLEQWQSGFLRLSSEVADFGPVLGVEASQSSVDAVGIDRLLVTATARTKGCSFGDVGEYRWSIGGKGTVLTLAVVDSDACPGREAALDGPWVRSDFPAPDGPDSTLPPGTYLTAAFDPFGDPAASGQLSYTVEQGWTVIEDSSATFVLQHRVETAPGQPPTDTIVALFAQPRMAVEVEDGATCDRPRAAPGSPDGVDDLVDAIVRRPGVVSTSPVGLSIRGYHARAIDLRVSPSWTGGCQAPEALIVGQVILVGAAGELGPSVGIAPSHPVRLILVDLTGGRTLAIAIFDIEGSEAAFTEHADEAMSVVQTFELHASNP